MSAPSNTARAGDDDVAQHDRRRQPEREPPLPGKEHGRGEHRELVGDRVEPRAELGDEPVVASDHPVGEIAERRRHEYGKRPPEVFPKEQVGEYRDEQHPDDRDHVRKVRHAASLRCAARSRSSAANVRFSRARQAATGVRRDKAALSSGCKSHPANAPAGSNRSSYGGNEMAEAFG